MQRLAINTLMYSILLLLMYIFIMQRLAISEEVWATIESKNVKKKLLKAIRKGDDEELARRAAFLFHVLQGTWRLPPDLACLLAPSHDLYVPRVNVWGRALPPNPTYTLTRTADEHQRITEHDYEYDYASDAHEEWNLIA